MNLGKWSSIKHAFDTRDKRKSVAGISGGSTSGMMAALLSDDVLLSFQNTGKEAERTYDFLSELQDGIGRQILWLEFRPPQIRGDRPCMARFAIVDFKSADRSGGPFEMMMDTLNSFRAVRGKGPIAPWWRSRICTAYMKVRTSQNYLKSIGWTSWDEFVGLRADEPERVAKMRAGLPRRIGRVAPLHEAGISKVDVNEFWDNQSFQLGLDPLMGNCTGCFLKDQSDLARALMIKETDAEWWIAMESKYPGWGGKHFAGYKQLLTEGPARLRIESTLRSGGCPVNDCTMDDRRFRLVVIQERKRIAAKVPTFSCGCEGSQTMAQMDEDEEEQFILGLPSEGEDVA